MADIPVYRATQRVPEGPQAVIAPVNAVAPDFGAIGTSIENFGKAGQAFALKLADAQGDTQVNDAKTKYLEDLYKLEQEYSGSQDFQTAGQEFHKARQERAAELLGGVSDFNKRTALRQYFTVHGISSQGKVDNALYAGEADFNVARLNERSTEAVRRVALAGSPIEAQSIADEWNRDVDAQIKAGWISRKDAVQRKVVFNQTTDDAAALQLIRLNPSQALTELSDPEKFKWLGPVQRENLKTQALAHKDQLASLELSNIAQRDPARALSTIGRITRPVDASVLFERGVIPIESNGDPTVVSSKGAMGLSQLMPGTARDVAAQIGRRDIAAMDDAQLRAFLTNPANAGINKQIGLTYFTSMLNRYDGHIAPALAAYNAGPGKADEWMARAREQFGPHFTAAQFQSVVGYTETRDYIGKFYNKVGGDLGGGGLSPTARLQASATASTAAAHQDTERLSAIKAIAQIGRETDDPAGLYKAGYDVDAGRYAAWRQSQMQAALAGDNAAAKALRDADFQRELLPFRQQALATPPAQLEALVGSEEARLANLANVPLDDKNRLDVFRETLKSVKEARAENPIGLAERARLIAPGSLVAIDPKADAADHNFQRALGVRAAQANAAAEFYQGGANVFKPNELAAMKTRWAEATPQEQQRLLRAFGANLSGQAFGDTLRAVIGENAQHMEIIARLAPSRPDLAGEILTGAALLKTKEIGEKGDVVRGALAQKFGGQIYPTPQMQHQVVDAALALYVARRGASGQLYDTGDQAALEQAIEDVSGPIIRRNGMRTPVTPGLAPRDFSAALDNLTQADVNLFGGAMDASGHAFSPAEISQHAVLKPMAPGSSRYLVGLRDQRARDGFAPIFSLSEAGAPLIVDMGVLAARHRGQFTNAPPTSYQQGLRNFRGGQWDRLRQDRIESGAGAPQ